MADFDNGKKVVFLAKHVICNIEKRFIYIKGKIEAITFTLAWISPGPSLLITLAILIPFPEPE
jgi:hypothetical protein